MDRKLVLKCYKLNIQKPAVIISAGFFSDYFKIFSGNPLFDRIII